MRLLSLVVTVAALAIVVGCGADKAPGTTPTADSQTADLATADTATVDAGGDTTAATADGDATPGTDAGPDSQAGTDIQADLDAQADAGDADSQGGIDAQGDVPAKCVAGECDDDNPCTEDSCDPSSGCVHLANSATCSDDAVCTVGDACVDGACLPGAANACGDGNPCTDDSCDVATGCVNLANVATCSDGSACTTGDDCDAGECLPGTATTCADGNPCTNDSCDNTLGCIFIANTATCSDGDACTTGDKCAASQCSPGVATVCNDANPCTNDSCDKAFGCGYLANTAPCSDGNACTNGDACAGSSCLPGAATSCDDGNACSNDSCVPTTGCGHTANTGACNDANLCTVGDICLASACLPGAVTTCDDANPCTDDSCSPTAGCAHAANAAPCSDGDGCTVLDQCAGAVCKGAPRLCDDANACTADVCLAGDCTATAAPGCTACFGETFPMSPIFAGKASSSAAGTVAWALQPSTALSAPFALSASWVAGSGTAPASATWTLPAVAMAEATQLEFWLDATLADPTCGNDDLIVRVGGVVVHFVCASTLGPVKVTVALPLSSTATPTTIELVALAGTGANNGGKIAIDNVAIGGACTPVAACASCAAGTSCNLGTGACEYHVVLSEFSGQGPASADDEFVELYNPGSTAATLTGLLLQYRSATNVTSWTSKVAGGLPVATIAPHGHYLIAGKSYVGTVAPDLALLVDMSLSPLAGTLQLIAPGASTPLDLLGYGATLTFDGKPAASASTVAAGSLERKASVVSSAASMTIGGAEALAGNGFDSEINAVDWLVRAVREPQGKLSPAEP